MKVFRRRRGRDGSVTKSTTYYGIVGGKRVNLGFSDKQNAEAELVRRIRVWQRATLGESNDVAVRAAATRAFATHMAEYLADLRRDCVPRYVDCVEGRLTRLASECGWQFPRDISADTFQTWRATQTFGPKTCNDYLAAASAFCTWMMNNDRLATNPLRKVKKDDLKGRQLEKRALTVEEVRKLLAAAGSRSLYYLVAVDTGLRRGEIEALCWGDMDLDGEAPVLTVRASTAKNRRQASIPLHAEMVTALRIARPASWGVGDRVFPKGLPRMRDMRKDFEAAKIPLVDGLGRIVTFHGLRYTFNMNLQADGTTGLPTLMSLMRHSDPKLTAKTYVDPMLLQKVAAVRGLPSFLPAGGGTTKGTTPIVENGQNESSTVHLAATGTEGRNPDNHSGMSAKVGTCPDVSTTGKWLRRQDSNLRPSG